MTALDHIQTIPLISEQSSTAECVQLMLQLGCSDLPVWKEDKLYGTVLLRDCVKAPSETIKEHIIPGFASAYFNTHILDLLSLYNETPFDTMAILGEEFQFMGVVTRKSLLKCFSEGLTVEQSGSVIVAEMATHQYSSSELARIIESENVQILGLWLENVPDSGRIRVNIKLNTRNAERVINSLLRFNYEVIATFGDEDYKENVEKRFQSLMKYLDI